MELGNVHRIVFIMVKQLLGALLVKAVFAVQKAHLVEISNDFEFLRLGRLD